MTTDAGKFSFKVPEGHPEQGKKIEKTFEYNVCDDDNDAQTVLTEKGWSLKDLVNDRLKSSARSNAYQAALMPYRPSEVSEEDIVERMVRDFIRIGVDEETARAQVSALRASVG